MKRLMVLLLVVGILTGCSNVYSEEEGYRMSLVNYGFPLPKNASEIKPELCVGEISKAAKYKLKNIGGEDGVPQGHYIDEILDWGWVEMKERSVDTARYFTKEDKIVCVVFQKHVFDVFEMNK